jgi:hypothetical protein
MVIQIKVCPESLVVRGQARLFRVGGSNPPGSVSTSVSDSNVFFIFFFYNKVCVYSLCR